jgi:hypothetical protein
MAVTGAGVVWLLALLANVEAGATVTTEARGGQAPVTAGGRPRVGVAATIRPAAEVRLRQDSSRVSLLYSPWVQWRYPNPLDVNRPLVLHTVSLDGELRPSATSQVGARAGFSAGEADYAVLPQLLGGRPSALPDSVELMVITGALTYLVEMTPRWRLGTELGYTHRRPLNVTTPPPPDPSLPPDPNQEAADFFLSEQNAIQLVPTLAYRLTQVDDLLLETGVAWEKHSSGIELYSFEPRVGWQRRLAPQRMLSLLAGVAYTQDVGERSATGSKHDVSPLAEGRLEGHLWREQQRSLSGAFGVEVEYYVDPVVAAAGPRAVATTGLSLGMGQNWNVGLDAAFGTSLKSDPMPGQPDETFVSVALPVRHRVTPHLMMEMGVRYSNRAPHFAADDFEFRQRELWVYLAATATTFPIPAFVNPSVMSRSSIRREPSPEGTGTPGSNVPRSPSATPSTPSTPSAPPTPSAPSTP